MSESIIIEIAVPVPLDRTFHYRVPPDLVAQAVAGHRALVPFGHRRLTGYILGHVSGISVDGLKEIIEVLDEDPLWTANELEFFRWIASYYLFPLGEVLKTALPSGINIRSRNAGVGGGRQTDWRSESQIRKFLSTGRHP